MKIIPTITKNGSRVPAVEIDAGEPLAIPLLNPDGTTWDDTGSSVVAYQGSSSTPMAPCPFTVAGSRLLLAAADSAKLGGSRIRVQVWSVIGQSATDGCADLTVIVH